jgi:MFS family permease
MARGTSRWIVLAVSWFASIAGLVSQQTPPPLMPLIMNDLRITHAEAGLIIAVFSIPGLAIASGLLADRFGTRQLGVMSILSLALGSFIVAISPSFEAILIGRVIGGIGYVSVAVIAPAIISQWFPLGELGGTAMGIYATGLPVAVVTSFSLLGQFGIAYNWRLPFYIGVVISIVALGLFWRFVPEGPPMKKPREESPNAKARFRNNLTNRDAWKIGLYFFLFMAGWTSFTTWAPTLLSQFKGLSLATAGFLTSLPMIISLLFMPLLGWFSDRLRRRKVLLLMASALATVVLFIVPETLGLTLVISFVLMGIAFALVPPTIFSLTGEALGARSAGTSFGILNTCVSLGGIGPVLIGLVVDITASLPQSLAAIGIFMGLSAVLASRIKQPDNSYRGERYQTCDACSFQCDPIPDSDSDANAK